MLIQFNAFALIPFSQGSSHTIIHLLSSLHRSWYLKHLPSFSQLVDSLFSNASWFCCRLLIQLLGSFTTTDWSMTSAGSWTSFMADLSSCLITCRSFNRTGILSSVTDQSLCIRPGRLGSSRHYSTRQKTQTSYRLGVILESKAESSKLLRKEPMLVDWFVTCFHVLSELYKVLLKC